MNTFSFRVSDYFSGRHTWEVLSPTANVTSLPFRLSFTSAAYAPLPITSPYESWVFKTRLVFYLLFCRKKDPTHLHLSSQIFVLVTDDRQSWLLIQSVGTVSERLLQSWRRRRPANFFITKAQAPLVWSWKEWMIHWKVLITQLSSSRGSLYSLSTSEVHGLFYQDEIKAEEVNSSETVSQVK